MASRSSVQQKTEKARRISAQEGNSMATFKLAMEYSFGTYKPPTYRQKDIEEARKKWQADKNKKALELFAYVGLV